MVITERDRETAAETGSDNRPPLEICPKCGWYDHGSFGERCQPKAGVLADQLIASMPEIRSGKLGFGIARVVFEIDDNTHVVFDIRNNAFHLESGGVFCLYAFKLDAAKELVLAIASIVQRNFHK